MSNYKPKIVKQIHKGRNNIYIINIDKRICILKKPKNKSSSRKESLKRQLKRIRYWYKFGLSKTRAIRYHGGILKTYIEGKTLNKIIDKDEHFFSESSKELNALKNFVELLIRSRHMIHDMKGQNIVFDGERFQIIDSGPIYKMDNVKKEYKKILYTKWSKLLDSNREKKYLRKFLRMRI